MTLPSSGTITIAQIAAEFGGDAPHSLSEYYRGGSLVTSNNTSVPTSGAIALTNFYGAVKQIFYAATGGNSVTTDGDYKYHAFTGSGTFAIQTAGNAAGGTIDYMVTAGGGGSGIDNSGCGGAGGMVRVTGATKSVASYNIVIGAGGAGAINDYSGTGSQGANSTGLGSTATGGGHGSNFNAGAGGDGVYV